MICSSSTSATNCHQIQGFVQRLWKVEKVGCGVLRVDRRIERLRIMGRTHLRERRLIASYSLTDTPEGWRWDDGLHQTNSAAADLPPWRQHSLGAFAG